MNLTFTSIPLARNTLDPDLKAMFAQLAAFEDGPTAIRLDKIETAQRSEIPLDSIYYNCFGDKPHGGYFLDGGWKVQKDLGGIPFFISDRAPKHRHNMLIVAPYVVASCDKTAFNESKKSRDMLEKMMSIIEIWHHPDATHHNLILGFTTMQQMIYSLIVEGPLVPFEVHISLDTR